MILNVISFHTYLFTYLVYTSLDRSATFSRRFDHYLQIVDKFSQPRLKIIVGRPTYMSADIIMLYQRSFFILLLFFSSVTLRARWTDSTQTGHMLGSDECDLKMRNVRNLGYPIP